MFQLTSRSTAAHLRQQEEMDSIINKITQLGYRPLLRSVVQRISECAGVPIDANAVWQLFSDRSFRRTIGPDSNVVGEVIFLENQAYVIQPIRDKLWTCEVRHHRYPADIDAFCEHISVAARSTLDGRRLRGMSFQWREAELPGLRRSARVRQPPIDIKAQPASFSKEDLECSLALLAREQRDFLIRLAQVGKARSVDARADSQQVNTAMLMQTGLVRREYLILCRQDSHTICSLPDKTQLETQNAGYFKCSICGRPFGDEQIQEIYALTDQARALLAGSHWMTIWITRLLNDAGVPLDSITWNGAAGEDEIDVMADVNGQRVFLELKDREFGLGDAYPFTHRVARYGGDFGLVVSTEQIGDEAKKFLRDQPREMGGLPIETIEGQDDVSQKLALLIQAVSRIAVNQRLNRLMEATGINITPFINAWMVAKSQEHKVLGYRSPAIRLTQGGVGRTASAQLPGPRRSLVMSDMSGSLSTTRRPLTGAEAVRSTARRVD